MRKQEIEALLLKLKKFNKDTSRDFIQYPATEERSELFIFKLYDNGRPQENQFIVIDTDKDKLAEGGNGKVYKGSRLAVLGDGKGLQFSESIDGNPEFVIKQIRGVSHPTTFHEIDQESKMIAQFQYDPHAHLYDARSETEFDDVFVSMAHAGNTLTEFLGIDNFDEFVNKNQSVPNLDLTAEQRLTIFRDTLFELQNMHAVSLKNPQSVTHRDIKPDNIFIKKLDNEKFNVKLGDFGTATSININDDSVISKSSTSKKANGTKLFFPPEFQNQEVSTASDVYAMVPVAVMLFGGNPFADKISSMNTKGPFSYDFINEKFSDFSKINLPRLEWSENNSLDLNAQVTKALSLMQKPSPQERPQADELLKFFNAAVKAATLTSIKEQDQMSDEDFSDQYGDTCQQLADQMDEALQQAEMRQLKAEEEILTTRLMKTVSSYFAIKHQLVGQSTKVTTELLEQNIMHAKEGLARRLRPGNSVEALKHNREILQQNIDQFSQLAREECQKIQGIDPEENDNSSEPTKPGL